MAAVASVANLSCSRAVRGGRESQAGTVPERTGGRMQAQDRWLVELREELRASLSLGAYWAFNTRWLVLLRAGAIASSRSKEHEQVVTLLQRLDLSDVRTVVDHPAVDRLLDLTPPLDEVLAAESERLKKEETAGRLETIRERRSLDPRKALMALFEILQQARDRREHGFKTMRGPRDNGILEACSGVMGPLCSSALSVVESLM